MAKRRSLAGNAGIGVFVIALVTTFVAFATPCWLVSDTRITSAKMDKIGLWLFCHRSLPNPYDEAQRRFFVGCRWVYDPFTKGWDEIRGYLLPPFMVATQFFYTLNFLAVLIATVLVLMFFLCMAPNNRRFILIITAIGGILLIGGLLGGIAVIVFACLGNASDWMPGHANNYLGWSFGLGVVGVVTSIVSGVLFFVERHVQVKKRRYLKESQTKFELDVDTKGKF